MLVTLLSLLIAAGDVGNRNQLSGIVRDEHGAPIAGATADIHTAQPRVGSSLTCPSCYRDCAKLTTSNDDGRFEIAELDPQLLFRVLIMAPGKKAQLSDWIDPAVAELTVTLEQVPGDLPVNRLLQGRVVDDSGHPVSGAIITTEGFRTIDKHSFSNSDQVDDGAISDQEGHFSITSRVPLLGIDIRVTAPGFAESPLQTFELNGHRHELRMRRGHTVMGRLAYQGHPVANRSVGIVQKDRSLTSFVGETVVTTDGAGSFQFNDLQPDQEYALYSLCDSNGVALPGLASKSEQLVLKTQSVTTGDAGMLSQLGTMELIPGNQLTGQLVFPPGSSTHSTTVVRLTRDPAWDWCETTASQKGEFRFKGLPPEVYRVRIITDDYELDKSQLRYTVTSPSEFMIRIGKDEKSSVHIQIPLRAK